MSEFTNNPPTSVDASITRALNQLCVPNKERDERAFVRSGLGEEVAPGRFVMTRTGFCLAYFLSQASDPVFQSALRDSGFLNDAQDITEAQVKQVMTAIGELKLRVLAAIDSRVVPFAPLTMHPGPNPEKSPLLREFFINSITPDQLTKFAAMRYVVRDQNIILPDSGQVSFGDLLIAETFAKMQAREGAVPLLQTTFSSLIRGLAAAGGREAEYAQLMMPRYAPGIGGALFFARAAVRTLLTDSTGLVELSRVLRGIQGKTDSRVALSDWYEARKITDECLSAAMTPAKVTMQALERYDAARKREA